jgi:N-acetylneuraminic acid mutarotase
LNARNDFDSTKYKSFCVRLEYLYLGWSNTGSMNYAREGHTSSVLANGKVLVCGGSDRRHSQNSVELYDPSTETWTTTGRMNSARDGHTSSVLRNGKVLVTGGCSDGICLQR